MTSQMSMDMVMVRVLQIAVTLSNPMTVRSCNDDDMSTGERGFDDSRVWESTCY